MTSPKLQLDKLYNGWMETMSSMTEVLIGCETENIYIYLGLSVHCVYLYSKDHTLQQNFFLVFLGYNCIYHVP